MKNIKFVMSSAACLVGFIFQSGCTNLSAVRDFAAVSSQGQAVQSAASELEDSPRRQLQYVLDDSATTTYRISIAIGKTNEVALVAAYAIIQNYMATLSTLASDGIVGSNNAVANFNTVLAAQRLINDTNAVNAYGKLAALISKAATDYYRRAKLIKMIEDVHDSFPLAVSNVQHIVTIDCVLQLSGETNMLNSYYLSSTSIFNANTPAWANRLVLDTYNTKMNTLQSKIQDCNQCATALGKIAAGYETMYKNRNRLGAKEFVSEIKFYQQGILDAYNSIKSLK